MSRAGGPRIWFADDPASRLVRGALWPAEIAYRAVVRGRNLLYDAGLAPVHRGPIPAVSIGNLTVGGTGKTPVAAWLAGALHARGARPAIVLRGYGADEPQVHARLNPAIPVFVAADRVAGVRRAAAEGATVAVLDDAFQHRRAARLADLVLVAAERGLERHRVLPAGPFREPVAALRRASLVVVTRKTATPGEADRVLRDATAVAGGPGVIVALSPDHLVAAGGGDSQPLEVVRDRRVTLITGVAEPASVAAQLTAAGAIVDLHAFPDHHAFTDADLTGVSGAAADADYAVCTLKDAVKIAGRWPGRRPLWYVSQRLTVERGSQHLAQLLDTILEAASANLQPAG